MPNAKTDEGPRWPDWIETWVIPFMKEPLLVPVWLAILGHVVLVFAMAVLEVFRGEGWFAAVLSTAVSVGLVGWELRLFRRPGPVSASVVGTWVVAVFVIWLGLRTGFL